MATKYYGIKDNWTDDDVANVIEVASEDGSVSSVKVNGVEYGGGGGDLTVADVTIINNTADEVEINLAAITSSMVGYQITGPLYSPATSTDTWQIPLYQGSNCTLFMGTVSTTGSITYDQGIITITGDGTITIS